MLHNLVLGGPFESFIKIFFCLGYFKADKHLLDEEGD